MEIQKYGWTYKAETNESHLMFDIILPDNIEKPKSLFKLYSLNNNSLDSLLTSYVYATHPNQFNDIFDCHDELIVFDNIEAIKTFYGEYYERIQSSLNSDTLKTLAGRHFREIFYRKVGVLSMTSDPNNILMWSYYTNHKGFMIEFELSQFPFRFHGPFPLNYQKSIDPVSLNDCEIALAALIQTNIKYKDWEHESEWRLIIESTDGNMRSPDFQILKDLGGKDRKFFYPISAIKNICLGNKFFDPDELNVSERNEKILNIRLKEESKDKAIVLDFVYNNKISLYMGIKDKFALSFTPCKIKKGKENNYEFIQEN